MLTWRRAPETVASLLGIVAAAVAITQADAARVVVLADSLAPTRCVAVDGEGRVLLGQSDEGSARLVVAGLDGESLTPLKTLIDDLPEPPTAMGWLDEQTLVVAGRSAIAFRLPAPTGQAESLATAKPGDLAEPLRSVAANPRFLFGAGGGAIWGSRRVGDRLTVLRRKKSIARHPIAVTINPQNYLLALSPADGQQPSFALHYLDSEDPEVGGTTVAVGGLIEPIQMIYDTAGESLWVLDKAGGDAERSGLYRIDAAAVAGGPPQGQARLVAPIANPTAFAVGVDRAVYVVADGVDRGSILLQVLQVIQDE